MHLTASAGCPGTSCTSHFVTQADGVNPLFPYQLANSGSGGPQILDVPATQIEYNLTADTQAHTLVVEALDQLGPVPQASLYSGARTTPLVSPAPQGSMLGSNKGPTGDGNISTNGQGPYTNRPQIIARSPTFVVQMRPDIKALPSRPTAGQVFLDTFENAENATIRLLSRSEAGDTFGNVGAMTFSMNASTPKEWTI